MLSRLILLAAVIISLPTLHAAMDDSVKELAAVGREGEGNDVASAAWKRVVAEGPKALPHQFDHDEFIWGLLGPL